VGYAAEERKEQKKNLETSLSLLVAEGGAVSLSSGVSEGAHTINSTPASPRARVAGSSRVKVFVRKSSSADEREKIFRLDTGESFSSLSLPSSAQNSPTSQAYQRTLEQSKAILIPALKEYVKLVPGDDETRKILLPRLLTNTLAPVYIAHKSGKADVIVDSVLNEQEDAELNADIRKPNSSKCCCVTCVIQ
jgi:hypothetical protein